MKALQLGDGFHRSILQLLFAHSHVGGKGLCLYVLCRAAREA